MTTINWERAKKRNNIPRDINKERIKQKWLEVETKYGKTYQDKNFFINRKLIQKYYPNQRGAIFNGCYFNAAQGRFEALKAGKILSSIDWKVGQPALIDWYKKFVGKI